VTDPSLATARSRALGAPTRAAIVAYLMEAEEPVTVAELTDHLGLNHNGVRKHLAQLVSAGLVSEDLERRTSRGRPRLLYRLDPSADVATDRPYERLAVLLATALATGDDPAEVGRRAGGASGPTPTATPLETFSRRFENDGFSPSLRRRGARTELVLGRCPFAAAAIANPAAVCRLHLGLAEGAAAAIGGIQVDELVPKDPRRAGCRLGVTETP
jgi:predicted ArsR family transcriptional regulator